MDISEYRVLIDSIGFGKRVADAHYVLVESLDVFPESLVVEINRAALAAQPQEGWNLIKFHLKEYALTFLAYPDFESDPHPALHFATKINLNSGRVVRTDYSQRANPPILHRKETFIPKADPRYDEYAMLTKSEEAHGLYRDTSRIGLRIFWETLLRRKGLSYDGHNLVQDDAGSVPSEDVNSAQVVRHRTAIKRYDLSKPVKLLLKHGLLSEGTTFFDYGCGRGMDVEGLQSLGFDVSGWDPAYRPDAEQVAARVVNIGYVLNVIEHPAERVEALRGAFKLCEGVMMVSVLPRGQETDAHQKPLGDGFLTKHGTFQKFYAPGELEDLLESCLEREPVTLALGMCLVFKDETDREFFLSKRTRRHVDWTEIGSQLRFSQPKEREEAMVGRYEMHRELMDDLWASMLEHGRPPELSEYPRVDELKAQTAGLKRSVQLALNYHGADLLKEARRLREEDVLVYLAMKHFERRFLRKHLPSRIAQDIKVFFGDFDTAMRRAAELLYASGDPDELRLALSGLDVGYYDEGEEHYSFHRSLFDQMPAIFRVYVLCGLRRFGDLDEVDVIKIHIRSRKLTLHSYDDFESKPLPELQMRIKIDLRKDFVTVFDHTLGDDRQLLFFKERFVGPGYEFGNNAATFSKRLEKLGITADRIGHGPQLSEFSAFLELKGLTASLLPKRK